MECGSLPTEKLDAVEGYLRGVVQTVNDDNLVAVLEKGQGREGPDIASASVPLVLAGLFFVNGGVMKPPR